MSDKEIKNDKNQSEIQINTENTTVKENIPNISKSEENNSKNENKENIAKSKKFKTRTILVIIALIIFAIYLAVTLRSEYLEILEIGEEYIDIFTRNMKYKLAIGITNFAVIFLLVSITNGLIKKGLKKFFEEEKKEFPKLPNKSIALIIALIASIITPNIFIEKVILFANNAQFGINDPIFNMDIGFFMFQSPIIGLVLYYLLGIVIALTIYTVIYYIVTFNVFFDGINGQTLKSNTFIKHLLFNIRIIAVLIVSVIIYNTQNIVLGNFLNLNDTAKTSLVGAGVIESTLQLWGYRILGVIVLIAVFMAIRYFKKSSFKNVIKSLALVPMYLVLLFIVMVGYNTFIIGGNELDREKAYIEANIDYTKTAYNLKINEIELNNTGTIDKEEANNNQSVLQNIPIVTEKVVLNNLKQTQTSTGYYTFNDSKLSYYNDNLMYITAREINSKNTTYKSDANEYTHGYGTVLVSASETDENGNIVYVSKDFEEQEIKEPRIYYGMETNSIITVSDEVQEFDYPMTSVQNASSKYDGEGGISLNFLDRIAVGIKNKKTSIIFTNDNSKILLNRNIIKRAKKIMPYLMYDENPYMVIGDDERLYWVLDAYTVSNEYPYSQKTKITYENSTKEINYIRNSVKVIVDAYNGKIDFYITDKNDPIIMVYKNMYNDLFKEQSDIPEGIAKYFTYSEFLYNIQAEMLTMYHDVAADVLYRANDVWQIALYSNLATTTSSTQMMPIYTMVKTVDSDESKIGLVQAYNLYRRESMKAYLVGTMENGTNKLTLYKFSNDSGVIGPIQLDNLISQDETISKEISSLNVTGTRITKEMIIAPINNTILYVIPIYQTSLNETISVPVLKKVVIASGNKIAIGDSFSEALKNLLSSNNAVSIEVEDTSTEEGLIELIIKANKNLTDSNNSNDWTQIGRDIEELQSLVRQLEVLVEKRQLEEAEEEAKKQEENVIKEENIILE